MFFENRIVQRILYLPSAVGEADKPHDLLSRTVRRIRTEGHEMLELFWLITVQFAIQGYFVPDGMGWIKVEGGLTLWTVRSLLEV